MLYTYFVVYASSSTPGGGCTQQKTPSWTRARRWNYVIHTAEYIIPNTTAHRVASIVSSTPHTNSNIFHDEDYAKIHALVGSTGHSNTTADAQQCVRCEGRGREFRWGHLKYLNHPRANTGQAPPYICYKYHRWHTRPFVEHTDRSLWGNVAGEAERTRGSHGWARCQGEPIVGGCRGACSTRQSAHDTRSYVQVAP